MTRIDDIAVARRRRDYVQCGEPPTEPRLMRPWMMRVLVVAARHVLDEILEADSDTEVAERWKEIAEILDVLQELRGK